MRSRDEFMNDQLYRDYLKLYYSGLAMQAIVSALPANQEGNGKKIATSASIYADEMIKLLMPIKS